MYSPMRMLTLFMIFLPALSLASDIQQEKQNALLMYIKRLSQNSTDGLSIKEIYELGPIVTWHSCRSPKFKAKELQKDGTFIDIKDPRQCFWKLQMMHDQNQHKNTKLLPPDNTWQESSLYLKYRREKDNKKQDLRNLPDHR